MVILNARTIGKATFQFMSELEVIILSQTTELKDSCFASLPRLRIFLYNEFLNSNPQTYYDYFMLVKSILDNSHGNWLRENTLLFEKPFEMKKKDPTLDVGELCSESTFHDNDALSSSFEDHDEHEEHDGSDE